MTWCSVSFPRSQGKIVMDPQGEGYGSYLYRSASLIHSTWVFLPLHRSAYGLILSVPPTIISNSATGLTQRLTITISHGWLHPLYTWCLLWKYPAKYMLPLPIGNMRWLCFAICELYQEQMNIKCSDLRGTGCFWKTSYLTLNSESTFKERLPVIYCFAAHKFIQHTKSVSERGCFCLWCLLLSVLLERDYMFSWMVGGQMDR